ncbi:DKNYY family protein [Leminorella grimontii]|uniref:DKNYY family protein n=1 Tax=Leminorella grimontii TaxID=82981 RepID=UPI00321F8BE2
MFRLCTFYIFILSLFSAPSTACSLGPDPEYHYQKRGSGTIYVEVFRDQKALISRLPDVKYGQLRRIADLSAKEESPLSDLTTDIAVGTALGDVELYSYHTDGRYVVWAGKVLRNPKGKPKVDATSFRAFGRFAADKDSLYFDGVRTDDNVGEKRVDMASLERAGGSEEEYRPFQQFNTELLRDRNNLYLSGRWLGKATGFAIVGKKKWDQRGKFYPRDRGCGFFTTRNFDAIVRTDKWVVVNSTLLDTDPKTFQIVRWIPNSLLIYKDGSSVRRYTFGHSDAGTQAKENCSLAFNALEDRVTWRKSGPTVQGTCQMEDIPGLDPELFQPISDVVAQYKDRLYVVDKTEFGEARLDVITLDDTNLIIDRRFNAGKKHGYLLTEWRQGLVQTGFISFETDGPLVLLNKDNGERLAYEDGYAGRWFARDDRYVYIFDGFQLYRYETADPAAARVFETDFRYSYERSKKHAYLATIEGVYDNNGVLTPVGQQGNGND